MALVCAPIPVYPLPVKHALTPLHSSRLVRPIALALHRARTHWNQLNQVSTQLAHLGTLLLTVGELRHDRTLTRFPDYFWPSFWIYNVPTRNRLSLGQADAARVFTLLRDFAFQLNTIMAGVYDDILVMIYCRGRGGRQQLQDVIDKWSDVRDRERQLHFWLDRAAGLQATVEEMIAGVGLPIREYA